MGSSSPVQGGYILESDPCYSPLEAACFDLKLFWVFATYQQIQETIKSFTRRAKECDFDMMPISVISRNEDLNPFLSKSVL
mmetsp:Transcript_10320/g.15800  ORF Transcript_10320/g.15800 Transcript_10320/m.15800 type:complete len:81 (+) Transcript_10320:5132-5374(+)